MENGRTSDAGGVTAIVAAAAIWGLSPLLYHALGPVPPLEVLAHRTLWSSLFFLLVLGRQGRLSQLLPALRQHLATIAAASVLISLNWFGFIFAVQTGRGLEASLGYYIFPLLAVLLGVAVFGERLARAQALAVGLAVLAVGLLSFGMGVPPWIALGLAGTFAAYGVVKRLSPLGPMMSTAAEVLLLLPLALVWLWGVQTQGWLGPTGREGGLFGSDAGLSLLLILSGPLTGLPLLFFSYASRRVGMVTLGLVQYLNPTLQCAVAVIAFGEAFTLWHGIAFGLIWLALAIYSGETLRRR